ncbi:non-ribosomal peptide synthetase [Teichococcus wenyumeiae]|uniref:non-ribosomal peptide synthetase n=1 Tax=Teichococcus wenyumeiae TaxID=2478470 RepID=UPI0022779543|nr:non-ribosomal peptide synthetase [Pseudoroseomonas wenyumeiae]
MRRGLRRDAAPAGATTRLPNGLRVAELNGNETSFLFREIFEDRCYLRHGLTLRPGDVVFDVGANIGLFSLFAAEETDHRARIHAFEPAEPVHAVLARNFALHGIAGTAEAVGLAEHEGEAALRYFPHLSIMSGRGAEAGAVRDTVLAYERDRGAGAVAEDVLDYRLESELLRARFTTLSAAMRERGVERIDFLKIDVEDGEAEVLRGIAPQDWPRIHQVVVEVHDAGGRAEAVAALLRGQGFTVAAEAPMGAGGAVPLVNLYARRGAPRPAVEEDGERWSRPDALVASLRDALGRALPAHMMPAEFRLLDAMPLTGNGKVDRRALARHAVAELAAPVALPPIGEDEVLLAAIWAEVLGRDAARPLGRDENFFELGGHSLLATRVASRVRDAFAVDLPIREVFEHPTVAALAACLAAHRRRGGAPVVALPAVTSDPAARHEPFPLTEIQQAYWLGRDTGFELGNVATHGYLEADCPGLDLPRFEQAWQRLVERHDMLRMVVLPGGMQQVRPPAAPYRIVVQDLRGCLAPGREAALADWRAVLSHQLLDAAEGPLFDLRASLLDGDLTRLHLSIDALWGDAHSLRVLMAELFQLYHAPATALPPLELTFRDYVLAEQGWRDTPWYAESLRYWQERLADFPPGPDLPLATSPSALRNPRFDRRAGRLEAADWQALKQRAARAGMTPTGVLLAAFADVLTAWSKSPRFTINLTLFNRHPVHPAVNRVVGDFTSLVLLAVDNGPAATFQARARRLQRQLWQDLDHRYVNGVTVLRELARRNGGTPVAMPVVFTSTLALAAGSEAAAPPGEVVFSITQTPQVWLDHKVSEAGGALKFEWDAIEALFPPGMLDAMFHDYAAHLLRLAQSDTAWKENSAERLPPPAQMAARNAANATAAPLPAGLLHQPWLDALPAAGARLAVLDAEGTLTHDALAARARAVAAQLGPLPAGQPVAVVMEKGWAQLAASLGVLMAGGAYVPLDPELPRERLAQLLARLDARVVLTQPWLRDRLPWPAELRVMAVEAGPARPDAAPDAAAAAAHDLAYVIFTSGSTGQPKGVMIDHRAALNTVADINARFGIGPADRVLSLSALGFDLSVYDIFGLLGAGGAVVLPRPDRRRDPDHWLALMADATVTVWNTVPALMVMLLDHLEERGLQPPPGLRLVLLSGDWIPLSLPDRIRAFWPEAEVVSLGGATEASIWSVAHPAGAPEPGWKSIPYGRPLANQAFHVLDGNLAPRPDWVPGELFIAGAGLAQGYWRDRERTEASFIRHPRTGERLYRTGDLGRYRPDGTLEFLGREDHQIKLRGHRIELGEVEAALLLHPEVRDAVVTLQGERHGPQHLVAHVVLEEAGAGAGDAADPDAAGVLHDAGERLRFKLSHPGLRADLPEHDGVVLPAPDAEQREALLRRRSHRRFAAGAVGLEALAGLLTGLMAWDAGGALPRRAYPSAGSLYPVQAYLSVKSGRVAGLEGGLYYYHPLRHRLLPVSSAPAEAALFGPAGGYNRQVEADAAFVLFLVGRPAAIAPLYGDAADSFALLEAGAMMQLLMQQAPEHGIGLCPVGRMDFAPLGDRLRLEHGQTLLQGLLGGLPEPTAATTWPEEPAAAEPPAQRLARHLAAHLPGYMLPAAILPLSAMPLTGNGKVDRAALRQAAPPAVLQPTGFTAPRDWLEQALAAQWQAVLDRDAPLGTDDNFFDLGGNSLLAVRLAASLTRHFGHPLMLTEIFNNPTVAEMAALLRGHVRPSGGSSLVPMRRGGGDMPFFCFPGSGGHALYLYHLARHMPAEVPFYALQSAAVDGDSPPLERIEAMAEHFIGLIRSVQPQGPYRLGGHSLGAKIALEVAQRLLEAGDTVEVVAVFDGLPFFEGEAVPVQWDDTRWLAGLMRAAAEFGGAEAEEEGVLAASLAPLDPEARLHRVKAALERHRFLPEGASLPQVRAMVALFRANTRAHLCYRPKPVRAVPVALFSPSGQASAARDAMRRAWAAIGPVALHVTPGTHLTMLAEPHVPGLAEVLAAVLRR